LEFAFGHGVVKGTDVDLAIIDHRNKACLCLQLKWFIQPAEIREIHDRTKDLADGIRQAKMINALHSQRNEQLMKSILRIDADYLFLTALSKHDRLRRKAVHACRELREQAWLRQSDPLPPGPPARPSI
jgi:hypothetical protein